MQSLSPESVLLMIVVAIVGLVNLKVRRGTAEADMTALVVRNYDEDRARLTKIEQQLAETTAALNVAQAERSKALGSIAEMTIELTKARAEIETVLLLKRQVEELQLKVETLQRQVFEMSEERKALLDERDQARREAEALRRQLEDEQAKRRAAEAEVERLKKQPERQSD